MITDEKRQRILRWWDEPIAFRMPIKQFCKEAGVMRSTIRKVIGVETVNRRAHDEVRARRLIQEEMVKPTEAEVLAKQIKEMDEAVFEAGKIKKIARMAELWYKRQGLLQDKQEITHKIDGGFIAGAVLGAERELRESGYRVVEVSKKPRILPEKLRKASGQGEDTNHTV